MPRTTRAPKAFTIRPTPSADTNRINANALITADEANRSTPKLRANSGIAGATIPNPAATKNATAASTATSRGSPASGPRRMTRRGSGAGPSASIGTDAAADTPSACQTGLVSSSTEAVHPKLAFASSRGRWVLTATILGSGVASLDATVVGIALPHIGKDFHAGGGQPAMGGRGVHADAGRVLAAGWFAR